MGEYAYDPYLDTRSRKRVRVLFGCVWAFLVLIFIVGATSHYLVTTGRLDGFEFAERWKAVLSKWERPISREVEENQDYAEGQPESWVEPASEIDRLLIMRAKSDVSGFAPSNLAEARIPGIEVSPDMAVASAEKESVPARYQPAGGAIIDLERTSAAISADGAEDLELSAGVEQTPVGKAVARDESPGEAIDKAIMAKSAGVTVVSELVDEAPSGEAAVETVETPAERTEVASALNANKIVFASDIATTGATVDAPVGDAAEESSRIVVKLVSGEVAEAAGAEAGDGPAAFPRSVPSAEDEGETELVVLAASSTVPTEDLQERHHREIAAPETTDQQAQPAEAPVHSPVVLTAEQQFDLAQLLDRGDQYLALGDVSSARLFYQLAAKNGSAKGAAAVGTTYDPVYLQRFGITGARSSPEQAIEWYRRAIEMGSSTAEDSLRELTAHLERAAAFGSADARQILKKLSQ